MRELLFRRRDLKDGSGSKVTGRLCAFMDNCSRIHYFHAPNSMKSLTLTVV